MSEPKEEQPSQTVNTGGQIQMPEPTDAQLKAFDAKVEKMIGELPNDFCPVCKLPYWNLRHNQPAICKCPDESQAIESTNSAAEKEIESLKAEIERLNKIIEGANQ